MWRRGGHPLCMNLIHRNLIGNFRHVYAVCVCVCVCRCAYVHTVKIGFRCPIL